MSIRRVFPEPDLTTGICRTLCPLASDITLEPPLPVWRRDAVFNSRVAGRRAAAVCPCVLPCLDRDAGFGDAFPTFAAPGEARRCTIFSIQIASLASPSTAAVRLGRPRAFDALSLRLRFPRPPSTGSACPRLQSFLSSPILRAPLRRLVASLFGEGDEEAPSPTACLLPFSRIKRVASFRFDSVKRLVGVRGLPEVRWLSPSPGCTAMTATTVGVSTVMHLRPAQQTWTSQVLLAQKTRWAKRGRARHSPNTPGLPRQPGAHHHTGRGWLQHAPSAESLPSLAPPRDHHLLFEPCCLSGGRASAPSRNRGHKHGGKAGGGAHWCMGMHGGSANPPALLSAISAQPPTGAGQGGCIKGWLDAGQGV